MPDFTGTLCLVSDRAYTQQPGQYFQIIEAAIDGGVTMVQLREKLPGGQASVPDSEFYRQGLILRDICRMRRIPLIVDDRLDMAMALEADGLHLGQSDLPFETAKRIWPGGHIFGITVGNLEEALQARKAGADYVGNSAVFSTPTKPEAQIMGPAGLTEIARECGLPVIAIGGIGPGNVCQIMASGCSGIAVVSAIWKSTDAEKAASELKTLIDTCLTGGVS